jgi:hypothetical protein
MIAKDDVTYTNDCYYSYRNFDPPNPGKKFVRRLKKDGRGFEMVEEDDMPGNTGGRRRDLKKSKAARKARKKNRRK